MIYSPCQDASGSLFIDCKPLCGIRPAGLGRRLTSRAAAAVGPRLRRTAPPLARAALAVVPNAAARRYSRIVGRALREGLEMAKASAPKEYE